MSVLSRLFRVVLAELSRRAFAAGLARQKDVSMNEATRILDAIGQGDANAAAQLLPLVYDELRRLAAARMAKEQPGQTLQPTALVHEAYLRLVGQEDERHWDSRGHFFAAAAEAMRRILIDNARRKLSVKHGGRLVHQEADPDDFPVANPRDPLEVMAVHEALDLLAKKSPRKAELVKLRYFLGCTLIEAAQVLDISEATAVEDWSYARAWLRRQWRRDLGKNATD
jgi:RNA polymerase sigma factor (TIGR02999 family)